MMKLITTQLALLLLHVSVSSAASSPAPHLWVHNCSTTNGNYTTSSTYKTNLDSLFNEALTTNLDSGFYNLSAGDGQSPDTTYLISLCVGNIDVAGCHTCQNFVINSTKTLCPNQKTTISWSDDCFASNETLEEYSNLVSKLLDGLPGNASAGDSRVKFASRQAEFNSTLTIYAAAQCCGLLKQGKPPTMSEKKTNDAIAMNAAAQGDPLFLTNSDHPGYKIDKDEWIIDSGASDHMSPYKDVFIETKRLEQSVTIVLPDGTVKSVDHVGDVYISPKLTLKNDPSTKQYVARGTEAWGLYTLRKESSRPQEVFVPAASKTCIKTDGMSLDDDSSPTAPVEDVSSPNVQLRRSDRLANSYKCTPNLTQKECLDCLNVANDEIQSCSDCKGQRGARVLLPSCMVRYEEHKFYLSMDSPVPSTSPSPGGSDTSVNAATKERIGSRSSIVAIGVVGACLLSSLF
ncbi:hypothetical protein V2J09_005080 [Rumex salicifolius]